MRAYHHLTKFRSFKGPGYYLYCLLLVTALFPYVTIIDFGSDVQPYSLIVTLVAFPFLFRTKVPPEFIGLSVTVVVATLFAGLGGNIQSLRAYYGYLTFGLTYLVAFWGVSRYGLPPISIIRNSALIWLAAGLIQLYFDPSFFHAILPREEGYGGRSGRGVESLTAEPTFYGFLILISCLFLYAYKKYNIEGCNTLFALLLFQLFFISRSSSAIGTLVLGFILFSFLSAQLKTKFVAFGFIILSLITLSIIWPHIESLRITRLVNHVLEDPYNLVTADASLNDRLFHIYYSIHGTIANYFLPHGFNDWWAYIYEKSINNPYAINVSGEHGRVMSYLGGIFFELGLFGLPIMYSIYKSLKTCIENRLVFISMFLTLLVLLLQSVPVSLALLPFALGVMRGIPYSTQLNHSDTNEH